MTDNEIKCEKCFHKSVCKKKTCAECQGLYCDKCELYDLYNGVPYIENCEKFIDADIINRPKADIESLQKIKENSLKIISMGEKQILEIREKSLKEFAECLKNRMVVDVECGCDCSDYVVDDLPEIIDELVKEMEKNKGYTEYAVEVYNNNGFVRQIDVFDTYSKAVEFAENYNEELSADEHLNITYIVYDKNENEIDMDTELEMVGDTE